MDNGQVLMAAFHALAVGETLNHAMEEDIVAGEGEMVNSGKARSTRQTAAKVKRLL